MRVELIVIASLICALAAFLTHRFARPSSRLYLPDIPNARSLHDEAKPRGGGIAIIASILVGASYLGVRIELPDLDLLWMAAALIVVAVIGYRDDRHSVALLPRFIAQGVAALILVGSGFVVTAVELPGVFIPLNLVLASVMSGLFIVWMINLYNFMDGMDGLAGGMTVIGFGTFAVLGYVADNELFFGLSLMIAAAATGFLVFNFPPARIFMGDAGAYSLGLLAAAFSIWGVNDDVFRFWIALLIFSPFIVDATFTLLRRAWLRRRVWEAHREHLYQRLILAGFKNRNVLALQYCIMLGCGATGVLIGKSAESWQWLAGGSWLAAYAALIAFVASTERAIHASK